MEVRRTPQTQVDRGQQAFANAPTVSFDPLEQGLQQLQASIDGKRRESQQFELQKRLLRERNGFTQQLRSFQADGEIAPADFFSIVRDSFEGQMSAIVAEYENYDTDLVQDFQLGLGRLNTELLSQALTEQAGRLRSRAFEEATNVVDDVNRAVVDDPDSFAEVYEFAVDTTNTNPYLQEDDRRRLRDSLRAQSVAATNALVLSRPEFVLKQLDPDRRFDPANRNDSFVELDPAVRSSLLTRFNEETIAAFESAGITPEEADAFLSTTDRLEVAELVDKFFAQRLSPQGGGENETEHPALKMLTGSEKLKAITDAYTATAQKKGENRAEIKRRIDIIKAQIDGNKGEFVEPLPTDEELQDAYGQGWNVVKAEILALQDRARLMQGWNNRPIEQIERELESLRPDLNDPAYPEKQRIYSEAQEVYSNIVEARISDPAAYAAANSPSIQEAVEAGDLQRFAALQRSEQRRLGIPPGARNIWPESYIQAEKQNYKTRTIESRVDWLQRHVHAAFFGQRNSDARPEFENFITKLEGSEAQADARVALFIHSQGDQGQRARMQNILPVAIQGLATIRQDPARRPSQEKLVTAFRQEFDNGILQLNGTASSTAQDIAAGIYVAKGGDPDLNNISLYRESLRIALGGVEGDSTTGWADFSKNGVKDLTILPPGVNKRTFSQWLDQITTEELNTYAVNGPVTYATRAPVTANDVAEEGVLVMVAPELYKIKFRKSGTRTEYAMGANGQAAIVRIRSKDVKVRPAPSRLAPTTRQTSPLGRKLD